MNKIRHPRLITLSTLALILTVMIFATSGCSALVPKKNSTQPSIPSAGNEDPIVLQEATGTYVGQIDNHSIEVIVDDQAQAFQLSEVLRVTFADIGLEEGQQVAIKYYQDQRQQLVICEITPLEDSTSPLPVNYLTAKGVFIGQIDSNSIEIRVEGEARPFWVAEELKDSPAFAALTEGRAIEFTYYLDEYERAVITALKTQ